MTPWTGAGLLAYYRSGEAVTPVRRIASTRASTTAAIADAPAVAPISAEITESKAGAWGRMQLVPIALELPDAYATATQAMAEHDRWVFTNMDRRAATALMARCGVAADAIAAIPAAAWDDFGTSCSVKPPDALVLGLLPDCRAALYATLMRDPANKASIEPAWFRVGRVDFRIRGSGLSEASTELFKSLLYPGTDDPQTLLFNDIKPALRAIADPAERLRFLKAVTRKRSTVARLLIDADSDTIALAEYWGARGRQADLLPLLNSVKFNAIAGVERPGKVNITSLLPKFVQERLYRHAAVTQPADRLPDDCYWTAFNFFSDVPDDRVHDMAYLGELIRREYIRISSPSQLGDVILIADANGDAIHAANYIADDIIFTKNGLSGRQPWMLTTTRDLMTQYRIQNSSLTVAYFRKR